jgi:hypothetical protein
MVTICVLNFCECNLIFCYRSQIATLPRDLLAVCRPSYEFMHSGCEPWSHTCQFSNLVIILCVEIVLSFEFYPNVKLRRFNLVFLRRDGELCLGAYL